MNDKPRFAVFIIAGTFRVASTRTPDMHEVFFNREEAFAHADELAAEAGVDSSYVVDLTNDSPDELGEFAR